LANPAASKEAAPATGSDTAADGEDAALDAETEAAIREDLAAWQLLGLLLLGLALVVVSGDVLVHSAKELALRWGVPSEVVAATLIAFGTSLPELVVGLTSIRKGHPELLVGNVVGADILNVLFVIGAAAVAAPLQVVPEGSRIFLYLHLPTLLLILVLFRGYIFRALRAGSFARWMGLPLLAIYVAYVVVQYWIAINDYATVPTLPGS
jgi:cation:H+ antiporter